ncbi:N-acetylmuramoyl-L-alanine amidase [Wielerella bovis]|uniref:N-acetylmuramoyl-L-alanine amidase n=1 Tax=Wielerella bovis TaxID=2917790 RepID=UPI002019E9A9|nr:N-acetylmuramoyl-L-alanine amidase [Wielerella bovis]ULJ61567.1 N-acetylmuramoyl-L-alanine amidase [Wielerella bovis]ULJ65753.1 N-acetylmuramoyl-L-alanine amidase [Wielerella bovis]ULJ66140.1 N-acetylmuramoyl-L-alanine amidase [Wielerella bovis]
MAKLTRRHLLTLAASTALTGVVIAAPSGNTPKLLSSRIVRLADRSRLILETDKSIKVAHFMMSNPTRLVVDLEGVEINAVLNNLPSQIANADAFFKSVRIGRKNARIVRIVFDLKQAVKVQMSTRAPSGSLKHRVQLDVLAANTTPAKAQPAKSASNNARTQSRQSNKNNDDPLMDLINNKQRQQRTTQARNNRRAVIVIDAGHGGKDPGTTGPNGTTEKSVVLATSLELKRQLEAKGYIVHMTRGGDSFVKLRDRRQHSRRVNADLFLSIHANASNNGTLRGADVFVWGRSNSERARELALAENNADYVDGIPSVGNKDVDAILTDMMQAQTTADSTRLGNLILKQMGRYTKLRKSTVETADFVVLRSVDIPSVLIELGFLSNPEEEKLLNSATHRRKLAIGIADAVQQYLRHTKR